MGAVNSALQVCRFGGGERWESHKETSRRKDFRSVDTFMISKFQIRVPI